MFINNIKNKLKYMFLDNEKIDEENYSNVILSQDEIDYMLKRLDELQNNSTQIN